jgi:hypothetical protein
MSRRKNRPTPVQAQPPRTQAQPQATEQQRPQHSIPSADPVVTANDESPPQLQQPPGDPAEQPTPVQAAPEESPPAQDDQAGAEAPEAAPAQADQEGNEQPAEGQEEGKEPAKEGSAVRPGSPQAIARLLEAWKGAPLDDEADATLTLLDLMHEFKDKPLPPEVTEAVLGVGSVRRLREGVDALIDGPREVEANRTVGGQVDRWVSLRQALAQAGRITPDRYAHEFRLCGEYWTIRYTSENAVEEGLFRDLEGLRHYAALLAKPEKSIEAMELQGLTDSPAAEEYLTPQLAMDAEAIAQAKREIGRLEEEADREERAGNQKRAGELRSLREQIADHLEEGRNRRLGSPPARDRARKAVGNAMRRALARIRPSMPECAKFLERSIIANGSTICYSPASPSPNWVL